MLHYYKGMEVIQNPQLTERKTRAKTFKERWLSVPWKPWIKTVSEEKPSTKVWVFGNKLIMHPDVAKQLEELTNRVLHDDGLSFVPQA